MKKTLKRITRMYDVSFRPASKPDLESLSKLGIPQSVIEFYSEHEPEEPIEGVVRLWPIEHVVMENTALMPGCAMTPHGIFVFATTFCGDTYCFDTNTLSESGDPRIVLVSHEVISEGSSKAEILEKAKPIAANLTEFLKQFAEGEVDDDCIY